MWILVMLGGALCHLLPDASEAMGSESYPISFCIAGVGYMLTMAMESIAMQLIERVSGNHAHGDQQHSQGCAQQVKHKTISQEVSDQSDATRNVIDIVQLGQRHNFHGDTDGMWQPLFLILFFFSFCLRNLLSG